MIHFNLWILLIQLMYISLEKKIESDSPRIFRMNLADTSFVRNAGHYFSRRINPTQNPE